MIPRAWQCQASRCSAWSASAWHGWKASNLQPSVLETDALPIELHPCKRLSFSKAGWDSNPLCGGCIGRCIYPFCHLAFKKAAQALHLGRLKGRRAPTTSPQRLQLDDGGCTAMSSKNHIRRPASEAPLHSSVLQSRRPELRSGPAPAPGSRAPRPEQSGLPLPFRRRSFE